MLRKILEKGHLWVPLFAFLIPICIKAENGQYILLPVLSVFNSYNGDALIKSELFNDAPFIKEFSVLGRGEVSLSFIALYGATSLFRKKNSVFFKRSLFAFTTSGIIVTILKYACHRTRPNTGKNMFYGPALNSKDVSFPSGHTQIAFTMAGIFSEKYGHPLFFYLLSSLVGLSRIARNMHYFSDVIMGAYSGYVISKLFFGKVPHPRVYISSLYFKKEVRVIYFVK